MCEALDTPLLERESKELWLTPNGFVEKLTLFLLGHALLQLSRTKFSVA
jgi:hypothetical protein